MHTHVQKLLVGSLLRSRYSVADDMNACTPAHTHTHILCQPHAVITQQKLQIWDWVQVCPPHPNLFLNLSALLSSNLRDFLNMARVEESENWTLLQS